VKRETFVGTFVFWRSLPPQCLHPSSTMRCPRHRSACKLAGAPELRPVVWPEMGRFGGLRFSESGYLGLGQGIKVGPAERGQRGPCSSLNLSYAWAEPHKKRQSDIPVPRRSKARGPILRSSSLVFQKRESSAMNRHDPVWKGSSAAGLETGRRFVRLHGNRLNGNGLG
jgi:hypothetical protein